MNAKIRKDREFVSNLINDRERFQPVFVRRFRDRVFKIIDLTNQKIDPSTPLSIEQKYFLLNDLIDNLFTEEARQLNDFLIGKRLVVEDKKSNKYVLVDYSEIYEDMPKTDEENHPTLECWIYVKACIFVRTKLLVIGILNRNFNVIKSFLLKPEPPSCQPIISDLLFDYRISWNDIRPQNVANDIAGDLIKDDSLLRIIRNYRYEGDFYRYVKRNLLKQYISVHYKNLIGKVLNPIYRRTEKDQDPSSDRVLRDELKELYSLKDLLQDDVENVPKLKEVLRGAGNAYDLKEANKRRMELKEVEYVLPEEKIDKRDVISYSDDLSLIPDYEVEADKDYSWMLDQVFERMNRTAKGRKQVEILKLLYPRENEENRIVIPMTVKGIADLQGVSQSCVSKWHEQAKEAARKIAIELKYRKRFE